MIDLSSDTATRPTAAMRQAMAEAPVGDEQRREDPSVNALQKRVAALTDKEAALFLPSGTMCNAIAFAVHCRRGDAVILDQYAHPVIAEAGGPAVLANVLLRPVAAPRSRFTADDVRPLIDPGGMLASRTSLISIENTTNMGGGAVWDLGCLAELRFLADEHGIALHMDGARLMNAVVASGQPAAAFAAHVDTVWIDLSKGLGAPVGAVLAGPRAFIEAGRRFKHMFGGAMRQAGVIAAAGLYAVDHHVDRLAEDHASAKLLEAGFAAVPGLKPVNGPVETNILFCDISATGLTVSELNERLGLYGVRVSGGGHRFRAVTHLDVSREDCERAVDAVRQVVV